MGDRVMGGCGLGPSLVKEIIEKHGGSIEVQSVFGEETSFTIRFLQAGLLKQK